MAKQNINVGTAANDKKGDSLRAAFVKVNNNFTELYAALGLANDVTLSLGAFEFTGSTISTTDSTAIVIDQATTITSNLSVGGDITVNQTATITSNLSVGGTLTLPANGRISAASGYNLTLGDGLLLGQGGSIFNENEDGLYLGGQNSDAGTYIQIPGRTASENGESMQIVHQWENASIDFSNYGGLWSFDSDGSLLIPGKIRVDEYLTRSNLTAYDQTSSYGLAGGPNAFSILQSAWPTANIDISVGAEITSPTFNTATVTSPVIAGPTSTWIIPIGTSNATAFTSTVDITYIVNKTWTFGTDGSLTIPGDIKSEGNINIDINLADSTLRRWQFGEDGNLETPGGVQVAGILKIDDGVHEQFQAKADATGVVTHDCSSGHIFRHTSPDANWTANFTNLNLDSTYATSITLIIVQGATGYYPSAVQIAGSAQTINWQGNVNPTVSTSRTDVVTFSIINNSGTYTVLGQLTGF